MAISYAEWKPLQNGIRDSYYFFRKQCPDWVSSRPMVSEEKYNARLAVHNANYKARRRGDPGRITVEQWMNLCKQVNNRCLCCKERTTLTVDHVIPFSLGGRNVVENIQPQNL